MARKAEPTFITEQRPFPKRLRTLLEENSVSQAKLAKFIGVTRQAVSLYATGQSTPDINIFCKIADYFDVSYDYLFGKARCKKPKNEEISKRFGLSEETIKVLEKAKQEGKNRAVDNIIRAVANAL